jgi:hypothetical protein
MDWHLAQVNISRFRKPVEDPANADFINALDKVNAIADRSPGFVWRFQGAIGGAVMVHAFKDPLIVVNMSVWESLDALAAFVYRDADHGGVMRRHGEWFEPKDVYLALWWIPAGNRPTMKDAKAKLELVERLGPTPEAFTFKRPFPPPGGVAVNPVLDERA